MSKKVTMTRDLPTGTAPEGARQGETHELDDNMANDLVNKGYAAYAADDAPLGGPGPAPAAAEPEEEPEKKAAKTHGHSHAKGHGHGKK